jgi:hypothetical protein
VSLALLGTTVASKFTARATSFSKIARPAEMGAADRSKLKSERGHYSKHWATALCPINLL